MAVTDKGVKTSEFLEACEDVVKLFGQFRHVAPKCRTGTANSVSNICTATLSFPDILGSTAFAPVKSDMNGNIKVRAGCTPQLRDALTVKSMRVTESPREAAISPCSVGDARRAGHQ